ncbi:hypothetical protein Desti_3457 [Desulfomonile tiedjei DSM 6799]|uniref:Uncharacterized protein n=1 Tax=Desulfomonile tiedjei (strain ATCC 49306 / DSM 6799 / DCB-1) TaxID=706587 RepID=I4C968_DESTA|nr:hypothetical protein Desti_3457 [Desulfomonile tiedjei DSM 6799]
MCTRRSFSCFGADHKTHLVLRFLSEAVGSEAAASNNQWPLRSPPLHQFTLNFVFPPTIFFRNLSRLRPAFLN